MLQSTIPVLPTLDLDETINFYAKLGFSVWSRMDGDYAIIASDSRELHFFLMGTLKPKESFFGCYWRVDDAVGLHAEYARAGIPDLHPVEEKPWGMKEFAFIDPHGNLIRIGQEID